MEVKLRKATLLLAAVVWPGLAAAQPFSCPRVVDGQHFYEREMTCPLGGETFKAVQLGTHSTYGRFLDHEPQSYLEFPAPLAVCPNGFIIYKEDFSEDELAALERIVGDPAYRAEAEVHSSYYMLGRIIERLNPEDKDLWWVFLQASWQAQDCAQALYDDYARAALAHAKRRFETVSDPNTALALATLIPNLHRRLGEFEEARATLEAYSERITAILGGDREGLDALDLYRTRLAALIDAGIKDQQPVRVRGE